MYNIGQMASAKGTGRTVCLHNTSKLFSNTEAAELLEFSYRSVFAPLPKKPKLTIWLKNAEFGFCGRAYTRRRYIVMRVARGERYPYTTSYPGLKTSARIEIFNDREHFVHLAAHEMFHVLQCITNSSFSELECESAGVHAVEKFRQITIT